MPHPRRITILVLLAFMEVLAGFAVVVGSSLLDLAGLGYVAFWLFLTGILAGLAIGLLVPWMGPGGLWNRLILLAGGVGTAALVLTISHGVLGMLVGGGLLGFFYWRGIALSQEVPDFAEVRARFGFGFAVLFIGLIWVVARGIIFQRPIWYMLSIAGIAYTVIAMAAMVMARLEQTREPGAGWAVMLAVGGQLLVLVMVALAALQLFSLDIAGGVWHLSQPLWDTIGATLFRFVTLQGGPIDGLISLIRPHHGARPNPFVPPSGPANGPHKKIHIKNTNNWPVVVTALLFLLAILTGIGYLIWRTIPSIPRRQQERGFSEQRRTMLTAREVWSLLAQWFRSLFSGGVKALAETVQRTRRRIFGQYPSDPVRRAYAQMLRRAGAAGLPRAPETTPQEYRRQLDRRWPAGTRSFAALTSAYEVRRYGETPVDGAQLSAIHHHWQEVRTIIRIPRMKGISSSTEQQVSSGAETSEGTRVRASSFGRLLRSTSSGLGIREEMPLLQNLVLLISVTVIPVVLLIGGLILLTVLTNH